MADFTAVANVADIPLGSARAYVVGRYEVALFHVADGFFALENACPHQGGPLADGFLEGSMVTCPWHAWCFDVRNGRMTLGQFAVVTRFAVRVDGSTILVRTEPEDE
ncbi:MAG: Rieske 2Fe-2S domain-containing protein [Candidatus Eremiobacteraeota bacterium]|nr:Rieske 2Fe-2S domain-containing protein [Candidatus Eremiobacteraeota bacterium]